MIRLQDRISVLVLYEQGVLSKEDDCYASLASGAMSAYDFMINKISNLEIEPAQLALDTLFCIGSHYRCKNRKGTCLCILSGI